MMALVVSAVERHPKEATFTQLSLGGYHLDHQITKLVGEYLGAPPLAFRASQASQAFLTKTPAQNGKVTWNCNQK